MKKRIIVKNISENLYEVEEYRNVFYAYKISVGFFNSRDDIGKAGSLRDALELIRLHSGQEIESMSDS